MLKALSSGQAQKSFDFADRNIGFVRSVVYDQPPKRRFPWEDGLDQVGVVVVTDGLVDGVIGTEDAWVLDPEDVFDEGTQSTPFFFNEVIEDSSPVYAKGQYTVTS